MMWVHCFIFSIQIINSLDSQSKFQMFKLFSSHLIGVPQRYTCIHVHGGSTLCSVNLPKTFRWISQVWENSETYNLEMHLILHYFSHLHVTSWQFLKTYPLNSFQFIFSLSDSKNSLHISLIFWSQRAPTPQPRKSQCLL